MRKCITCNKDFTGLSPYCSKQCFNIDHTRKCLRCGKNFILDNLAYERRGYGKYCSMQCSRFATKKFSLNENYFKEINSSNKAYWLGFCFADAYNSGNELILELATKDINHLDKIRSELNSDQIVKIIRGGKSCKIRFGSKILCNSLIDLGCIPKKSLVLEYPKIDRVYDKDFIRGVFDGDGCISVGKHKKQWSIFSGSEKFRNKIYEILLQNHIETKLQKRGNGFVICAYKKQSIKDIFNFLYEENSVCLERKRNKFEY